MIAIIQQRDDGGQDHHNGEGGGKGSGSVQKTIFESIHIHSPLMPVCKYSKRVSK